MTVGQRIAQKRKELGLSQEGLGDKLGVSRQAIYKWESDASLPEVEKLVALSRIFSVPVGWLLGEEEHPAGQTDAQPTELTEAQMQRDGGTIRRATGKLFSLSMLFSSAVGLFMFVFADQLGVAVYKSYDAGRYIRLLAPLVPVMYTDMTVDGCLKGLGQQVWCMGINILDSLLGLILVWAFLPSYALAAYIAMIYITETLNFVLSAQRLWKTVKGLPAEPEAAARR